MPSRFRDNIAQPLTVDYFHKRLSEGWIITAVEWSRPLEDDEPAILNGDQDVPYGQRIAEDCGHLTAHAREMEVIAFIYDGVIGGTRPGQVAIDLNKRDYQTRSGMPWTASAVFELMPRIIELSPRLQRRPNWPGHRAQLSISS